jgi:hypothetical protein
MILVVWATFGFLLGAWRLEYIIGEAHWQASLRAWDSGSVEIELGLEEGAGGHAA